MRGSKKLQVFSPAKDRLITQKNSFLELKKVLEEVRLVTLFS